MKIEDFLPIKAYRALKFCPLALWGSVDPSEKPLSYRCAAIFIFVAF